jgi:hypothetical protein
MWKELKPLKERYYLYIRNARDEDEERFTISRQWTYILSAQPKQRPSAKSAASGDIVNIRLKSTWNLSDRHVNANSAWNEPTAIADFKKLAGVRGKFRLRVEDQALTKVRFQINAAFTYTLVVTA